MVGLWEELTPLKVVITLQSELRTMSSVLSTYNVTETGIVDLTDSSTGMVKT